ncbi:hypothetical protein GOP47_0022981 [Adiantum capillus-veneris]|uniref:Uncharacterized protein n=1 Tax=Adiantum capillus-veneris TaxID=13818 RepID=A0A9D4U7I6_ADICA|nr:hypothetical protein GOP47_0022981 [Adiantum capillus-veneris]
MCAPFHVEGGVEQTGWTPTARFGPLGLQPSTFAGYVLVTRGSAFSQRSRPRSRPACLSEEMGASSLLQAATQTGVLSISFPRFNGRCLFSNPSARIVICTCQHRPPQQSNLVEPSGSSEEENFKSPNPLSFPNFQVKLLFCYYIVRAASYISEHFSPLCQLASSVSYRESPANAVVSMDGFNHVTNNFKFTCAGGKSLLAPGMLSPLRSDRG